MSLDIRKRLDNLKTDEEFTAFCLDEFPEVQAKFSAGMERTARINLVFQYVGPEEVDRKFTSWFAGRKTLIQTIWNPSHGRRLRLFGGLLVLLAGLVTGLAFLLLRQVSEAPEQPHRPNMLLVQPGKFLMNEPQTLVTISVSFLMSETEVTQGQYQAVMGENPSLFRNKRDWMKRPVESVSWFDAVRYCNRLSLKEGFETCYVLYNETDVRWPLGLQCRGYRLPTEAEWEYAARAAQGLEYAGSYNPDGVAWYGATWGAGETHPVKKKNPNGWGFYDMSGNVWEWVWDEEYDTILETSKDPIGPKRDGSVRISRGGSYSNREYGVRIAHRSGGKPSDHHQNQGFRIARSCP